MREYRIWSMLGTHVYSAFGSMRLAAPLSNCIQVGGAPHVFLGNLSSDAKISRKRVSLWIRIDGKAQADAQDQARKLHYILSIPSHIVQARRQPERHRTSMSPLKLEQTPFPQPYRKDPIFRNQKSFQLRFMFIPAGA